MEGCRRYKKIDLVFRVLRKLPDSVPMQLILVEI
jgi:hypothetical protein